jgi:hypothetical protein
MDLAWTNTFDQLWRSPTFPMWLTLAAATFFAIVFLVIVLRADRSVANGALAVMTLLAVAVAVAATVRGFGGGVGGSAAGASFGGTASIPALSCVDDLAGDSVEAACEKVLFGSPDHVAAAVSYAAARLDRLTALGDVAAASHAMTPELLALRRAVERDRYGLTAHVLVARDGCTAAMCPAYRSLTDRRQIAANIEGRVYDGLVTRYTPAWSNVAAATDSAAPASAAAAAALTGEPPSVPTGKPTDAEFPSSASIPPVSIMTPEPSAASSAPSTTATPSPVPRPAAASHAKAAPKAAPKAASHSSTAARRPANPAPPPPVQLTPAPSNGNR